MISRSDPDNALGTAAVVAAAAPSRPGSLSDLQIAYLAPERLRAAPNNARRHSKKQLKQIAKSIERFGFVNPILISDDFEIIAGHGRLEAAKLLGLRVVPTVRLSNLSPADRRAYVIADNRLAELSGWDRAVLASELQGLLDLQFDDIALTGFSLGAVDHMLGEAVDNDAVKSRPEDAYPPQSLHGSAVSRTGDLWLLGAHRLLCGDAADPAGYQVLLDGQQADLVLTAPPIVAASERAGADAGRGGQPTVAPASTVLSEASSIALVTAVLHCAKANTTSGAILFVFTDWRHLDGLLTAGRDVGLALVDLIVWAKDDAVSGGLYPCRHALVLAFQNGAVSHTADRQARSARPHQRLGLCRRPRLPDRRGRGSCPPSDQDAGGACCRRHSRCDPPRRHRPRSICRNRHDHHRCRTDPSARPRHRTRSAVLRRHRPALAALYRDRRAAFRIRFELRAGRSRAPCRAKRCRRLVADRSKHGRRRTV